MSGRRHPHLFKMVDVQPGWPATTPRVLPTPRRTRRGAPLTQMRLHAAGPPCSGRVHCRANETNRDPPRAPTTTEQRGCPHVDGSVRNSENPSPRVQTLPVGGRLATPRGRIGRTWWTTRGHPLTRKNVKVSTCPNVVRGCLLDVFHNCGDKSWYIPLIAFLLCQPQRKGRDHECREPLGFGRGHGAGHR